MKMHVRIAIDQTGLPELVQTNVKHRSAEFNERIQPVSERIREFGGEVIQKAFMHFNIIAALPAADIAASTAAIRDTEHVFHVWPASPAKS
jgi:hypothetical protein